LLQNFLEEVKEDARNQIIEIGTAEEAQDEDYEEPEIRSPAAKKTTTRKVQKQKVVITPKRKKTLITIQDEEKPPSISKQIKAIQDGAISLQRSERPGRFSLDGLFKL